MQLSYVNGLYVTKDSNGSRVQEDDAVYVRTALPNGQFTWDGPFHVDCIVFGRGLFLNCDEADDVPARPFNNSADVLLAVDAL